MSDTPHVAMFYDVPNWSFHNIARNISTVVPGYEYSLYAKADWHKKPDAASRIVRQADVIVFLWRFDALTFLDTLDEEGWAHLLSPDRPAIVSIVYDHLHQDEQSLAKLGDPYAVCDVVCTSSKKLKNIYNFSYNLPDIMESLADGVNLDLFYPKAEARTTSKPLSIGWVGNSDWGQKFGNDLKGRRGIFDVALSRLEEGGLSFEPRIADRAEGRLPFEEMPEFYRNLDVLVCTSAIEGTPNPVLEAMASGAAIVSTDVGIVTEVLGEKQSQFIIERSPEALFDALASLIEDRQLHLELCAENVSRRELLSWKSRAPLWRSVFQEAMSQSRSAGSFGSVGLGHYRHEPWENAAVFA